MSRATVGLFALAAVLNLAAICIWLARPAPKVGDSSALTVAAEYVKDLGVQAGVAVISVSPEGVRSHGNITVIREKVVYRYPGTSVKFTTHFAVHLRRSAWTVGYAVAVG